MEPEVRYVCRVFPNLKLLHGSNWESKHWQQALSIIGLANKSKEIVTLKDLLSVAETLVAKVSALKDLDAQAQGESVIRRALDELDLWGFERKFTLVQSKDCGENVVCFKSRHFSNIVDWVHVDRAPLPWEYCEPSEQPEILVSLLFLSPLDGGLRFEKSLRGYVTTCDVGLTCVPLLNGYPKNSVF
jgi:hypothetical protein